MIDRLFSFLSRRQRAAHQTDRRLAEAEATVEHVEAVAHEQAEAADRNTARLVRFRTGDLFTDELFSGPPRAREGRRT